MPKFQLKGVIYKVGAIKGDKYKSAQIVVKTTDIFGGKEYHNHVSFVMPSNMLDSLGDYKVGQEVLLMFSLNGKEYSDKNTHELKYFNELKIMSIKIVEGSENAIETQSGGFPKDSTDDANDDLPF